MTKELKIKGMSCQHCVKHVTNALQEVAGVTAVKVDLDQANATVETDGSVGEQVLKDAVAEAGYEVTAIN